MKPYKLIIFDLDGTLVDAYKAIEASFNFTMKALGYPKKDSLTIRRAVGWGDENLLKPFIKEKDLKKAVSIYREHHKISLLKKSRVFPGVKNLLGYFRNRGIKLAIATNRPTKFTHILLRRLDIEKFFDYVLCADKLKTIKPHPEILLKIMRKLKSKKDETVYVGDMQIDIKAGRRAKIDTFAVFSGSHTKAELQKEKPTRILPNVLSLRKKI
jgi:phosphoglycolate phosphatase